MFIFKGSIISKFVASNFVKLLTHMKSYKSQNYEQAMIETYLKFDELLRHAKVDYFLKEYMRNSKSNKLDITFSYGEDLLEESGQENKDTGIQNLAQDGNTNSKNKSSEGNSNSNKSKKTNKTPKENIVDLTKKDNESDSEKTKSGNSGSKEVLEMENQKMEISLRHMDTNTKDNDLLAKDMGTTANIILIKNNYIYVANVGDSMAVVFKNGEAIRLNQEHKTTLPSEYTRITKSGSKIVNNRIEGRLNLTRAIGKNDYLYLGDLTFKNNPSLKFYEQAVIAYPEITKIKITKDIDFIFMACDGVWDCVDVQKVCEHISIQLKTKKSISDILADLLDQIISKANNSIYI